MSKYVLITGANGGIGRSLVETFAEAGYQVIANMRAEKEGWADFAKETEEKYQVTVRTVYFDVTDTKAVSKAVTGLFKEKIFIDVLVNNAGVAHGGLLQMTSVDTIRQVFDTNYFSVVNMTQAVSRLMMRKKQGSIVNIASVAGIDLDSGNCAYGVSKAAVIAFTRTIAKEMAPYGIRINAVAPGLTDTRMAVMMEDKAGEAMVAQSSMKRLGDPKEIAETVLFLASDKASFITGQTLRVDGGM